MHFASAPTVAATCLTLCFTSLNARGSPPLAATPPACGADHVQITMRPETPGVGAPSIPDGKALVYVIELMPNVAMITSHVRVGIDGRWVAQLRGQTSTTLIIDPGVHHFCTRYEGKVVPSEIGSTVLYRLEAEAGKTYYLLYRGFLTREAGEIGFLDLVDEDEGRYAVSRSEHVSVESIK